MSYKTNNGLDNPSFELSTGDVNISGSELTIKSVTNDLENPENRAQWGNGVEFLMSCIAMSVGLGNIWRFPFTAYENGGGAFLIPYIIVLLVIGRPLYYLEMSLGQFSSRGNVKMFESMCPALKGVGYGQLIAGAVVATYYCSLMAVTIFYFVNSFTSELPWSQCRHEWETNNTTCIASILKGNISISKNAISSSELYYLREVLKEKYDISDGIGLPEWRLTLCLFISWVLTFLVSCRGVSSSGKAAYFLAIFPYVVMVALLIRAVTLDGSIEGMMYFIKPDWTKLLTAQVWYAAVTQCFFSLGVGFGTITMYSSYNKFDHNINRDAMVVTSIDTLTSLLAGSTIFGILGNLAYELNVDVKDVIKSGGSSLAFISYPEAIAKFETVPWLFALLFFGMLFVLGIGSLVAIHCCANTVIMDSFPQLKTWQVSGMTAIVGFLVGLVYVTPGGQFILTLVDYFGGTFIIFILTIVEIVSVVWIYGLGNICDDIEFMVKTKVGIYWRIMWGMVTPALLIVIFIYFLATLTRLKYGPYDYPNSTLVFGWLFFAIAMLQFIVWMFYYICKNRNYGFPEMIRKAFSSDNWRPKGAKDFEDWKKFKEEKNHQKFGQSTARRKLNLIIGIPNKRIYQK